MDFEILKIGYNYFVLAVLIENEVIGKFNFTDDTLGLYVSNFHINEVYRCHGIGRKMLKHLKEKYPNKEIGLAVKKDNQIAMHLYQSEQFEIIKDCEYYYEMMYKPSFNITNFDLKDIKLVFSVVEETIDKEENAFTFPLYAYFKGMCVGKMEMKACFSTKEVYLNKFKIVESLQHRGIGRKMLQFVKTYWKNMEIIIDVEKVNSVAFQLCKSENFETVKDNDYHCIMKFNKNNKYKRF